MVLASLPISPNKAFFYDATEKLLKRTDKKSGGDRVTYYVGGMK